MSCFPSTNYGYYNIPTTFIMTPNIGYPPCGPYGNSCEKSCNRRTCHKSETTCEKSCNRGSCVDSCDRGSCAPGSFCVSNCCSDCTGCGSPCGPVRSPCGQNLNPYPVNVNCAAPYDPYWPNSCGCGNSCGCERKCSKSDSVVDEITENQKTNASCEWKEEGSRDRCGCDSGCGGCNNNFCGLDCLSGSCLAGCAQPLSSICGPYTSPCAYPYASSCASSCAASSCGSPFASSFACGSSCATPYASACNPAYFATLSFFVVNLTATSVLNYTFTIANISTPTTYIAQGTATLIGNILNMTFVDTSNIQIGVGNINFVDYNLARQGILQLAGTISTTLPLSYVVYPSTFCGFSPVCC